MTPIMPDLRRNTRPARLGTGSLMNKVSASLMPADFLRAKKTRLRGRVERLHHSVEGGDVSADAHGGGVMTWLCSHVSGKCMDRAIIKS